MALNFGSPADFHDLCVANGSGWRKTVNAALEMGYHRVAVETYLKESEISFPGGRKLGAKRKKTGDEAEGSRDIPPPNEGVSRMGFNDEPVLHRLTFDMSDPLTAYKLSQSRNAKKYDIVAIRPTSLSAFQSACQTQDVDIVQLRLPLEFRLQRKMVLTAARRGVAFELLYAPMLLDDNVRMRTISLAHELFTLSKSKNLIVSSGAEGVIDLRGPLDVCNLCGLLGLDENGARKCVMANARAVLLKALGRRTVKGIALARPLAKPAEEAHTREDGQDTVDDLVDVDLPDAEEDKEDEVEEPAAKIVKVPGSGAAKYSVSASL